MSDNVLQFSTRVDLSGAKAGLADLASEISSQMQTAADSVAEASASIAESFQTQSDAAVASADIQQAAYAQLAAATLELATARRQVADAQSAYLAGELPAADAEAILAESLQRSTEASSALAGAKANLADVTSYLTAATSVEMEAVNADTTAKLENAAATEANTVAEDANTSSLGRGLSARMAAGAEIRVLEGNIQGSSRAAAAFLTMIPGVGAALQAAFAVFGAIALIEVIVQIGEALYKAFDVGGERAAAMQAQMDSLNHTFEQTSTEIEIQTQKLEEETAKLEHKPFNGLQLALLEAQDAADKLVDKLKRVQDEERKALQLAQGSGLQRFFGLSASSHEEEVMLAQHEHWLSKTKDTQGVLNEITSYGNALQQRKNELIKEEGSAYSEHTNNKAALELQTLNDAIDAQQKELALAKDQQAEDAARKAHQSAVDHHAGKGKESQAMKDMIREAKLYEETNKKIHETLTRNFEDDLRQQEEIAKQAARLQRQAAEEFYKDQATKIRAVEQTAKAEEDAAKNTETQQLATIAAKSDLQQIDALSSARQTAAAHTEFYTAKLAALEEELRRLQALENGAGKTLPAQAQIQTQIASTRAEAGATGTGDQARIAQDIAAPYLKAFNTIDQQFRKVQNDMIAGNKNIKADFLQMGVHLVQDAAAASEKILADFIRHQILKVAAKQTADAATVASAATSSAAQNAIEQQSLVVTLSKEAVKAAAKSYAWAAAWGGPIAGAIAAAVAFTGVESLAALAAFEQGGIVGGSPGMPVPIVAHAGERVLSAPQTQNFERMVNGAQGGGSNSRALHLNYSPTVNAFDRHGFRSTLQAHQGDIVDIVKQAWSRGGFK